MADYDFKKDKASDLQNIEKIIRVSLLLDFYGPLLTQKQKTALTLFYEEDFSLGEIAQACGISRQAVHDSLRRGEALLEDYEKALGLAEKHIQAEKLRQAAETELKKLENEPSKALWEAFWNKWQQT